MEKVKVEDQLIQIEAFFKKLHDSGMYQKLGIEWPVRVHRELTGDYIFYYPESYLKNLVWSNHIYVSARTKRDRVTILRWLLDKITKKEIDIHIFHLGLFLIYNGGYNPLIQEDINQVGSRRRETFISLPRLMLMDNDDFLAYVWGELGAFFPSDLTPDYRCNPILSDIRMLFKPERYGHYTGIHVSDADWVEPVSGARDNQYHKWISEQDPTTPEASKPDMHQGPIILGHPGWGNTRHFVCGEPLYAGCYIEVKYGDGWIPGRYRWDSPESRIGVVSSSGEVITIDERHLVRILK
ncbi:hypothetical protein [Paenibacillus taichungensis]|uniref:hypothetical protein n=1 Tax=Paenibacillus taichungensis TaxID=484184 RepID=UPI0035DBEFBC